MRSIVDRNVFERNDEDDVVETRQEIAMSHPFLRAVVGLALAAILNNELIVVAASCQVRDRS